MLRPRIIPTLLVKNRGLVKTVQFADGKYVGDPINAVRIFNEKEADELIVVDIDATIENREPDYRMIDNLACECRMPLCYGGGITTVEQARKILSLGVEKVALSSSAFQNPMLISQLASQVGSQSIVVVLDVRKTGAQYECFIRNGKKPTGKSAQEFSLQMQSQGAGEILINSIDNDGVMKGYDLELVRQVKSRLTVPVTVLGGAGSLEDLALLVAQEKIIGAAAGSLFVFKGKYKAVLINYPNRQEKEKIWTAMQR